MSFFETLSNLSTWQWQTLWTSIGSLATLITAIATFYTVREMKIGREQALEPHLIILRPNELYHFRWVPAETLQPIIRPQLPENKLDQYGTRLPVFRLKNIGNGPSKNIQITWRIKEDNAISIVSKSSILNRYNASIEGGCLNLMRKRNEVTDGYT